MIEVTNLNDSGPGSLRAAIDATGPRFVVFRTGGTIQVQSQLEITEPFITIAGQSAPGGGIQIDGTLIDDAPIGIYTHDVVMRYLRVRPGRGASYQSGNGDCISGGEGFDTYNVVLDHCSFQWGNDENVAFWSDSGELRDITIQNCIIAEGLNHSNHSTGLIFGSNTQCLAIRDLDVHHNLFMSQRNRNPYMKGNTQRIINNLIHNYGWLGVQISQGVHVDIIGNLFTEGPENTSRREIAWRYEPADNSCDVGPNRPPSILLADNRGPHNPAGLLDDWNTMMEQCGGGSGWGWFGGAFTLVDPAYRRTAPLADAPNAVPIGIDPVADLAASLMPHVGASQRLDGLGGWIPARDAVDARLADEYANGLGHIPIDENDAGGFPVIDVGIPYADNDHDGMADAWETLNGLNSSDAGDGALDADGDGYSNVEEFLNATDPTDITIGTDSSAKAPSLSAWPNPFTDSFSLRGAAPNSAVRVLDAAGRSIFAGTAGELNGQAWAPGTYTVLIGADGQRQAFLLIKQ